MPLVLLVEVHDLQYQKPLRDPKIWLTSFLLYLYFLLFHFSSMTIKVCCVPCDFLKPVTHFEILFSIKLLIWL